MGAEGATTGREYYLRDHTGREVAIYDYDTNRIKQINLFGDGLTGTVKVDWSWQWVPAWCHPDGGYWELTRSDSKYYYIKDHLGNIRVTLVQNGTVVSARDYYPYGETLRATTTGGVVDRYQFTEKERDAETNLDYFGARYYDGGVMRWLIPDPLADKYYGWSPYNYTLGNPLRYVDPDGMRVDDYMVDSLGVITLIQRTDDDFDVLYSQDGKSSIEVDRGILDNIISGRYRLRGEPVTYQYMEIFGDHKATNLFEFLAQNTKVEWSQIKIGINTNFITTSQRERMEFGGPHKLFQSIRGDYPMAREGIHSHPRSSVISPDDKNSAKEIHSLAPSVRLGIYHVPTRQYIYYNQHGALKP